jgi:predicted nucleotidyltransferase
MAPHVTPTGKPVTTLIDQHREQIERLCRAFHVRRLDVFGSAIREDFDPARSDIDFLVDYDPAVGPPSLREYFRLRDALAGLVGRPVDLVMAGAIRNRYINADIEATREPVHAA